VIAQPRDPPSPKGTTATRIRTTTTSSNGSRSNVVKRKVGMVGISGYAGEQWRAAAQGHPALESIFRTTRVAHTAACSDSGTSPGGVLHSFPYLLDSSARSTSP